MLARNAERLDALADALPNAYAYPCEVTDREALAETIARVRAVRGAGRSSSGVGVWMMVGVLPALARQVGRKSAFDLMATGRTFDANEAVRFGIISRTVAGDQLLDDVMGVAQTRAGYSRESMSGLKRLLDRVVDLPLADGLAFVRADRENNSSN